MNQIIESFFVLSESTNFSIFHVKKVRNFSGPCYSLESKYPDRIDLSVGRAPGTHQQSAMDLRWNNLNTSFYYKDDIFQLQQFLSENDTTAQVRALPGEGLDIPIYILGSSTESAYLATDLGLPYAFASHFAPAMVGTGSRDLSNTLQTFISSSRVLHDYLCQYGSWR